MKRHAFYFYRPTISAHLTSLAPAVSCVMLGCVRLTGLGGRAQRLGMLWGRALRLGRLGGRALLLGRLGGRKMNSFHSSFEPNHFSFFFGGLLSLIMQYLLFCTIRCFVRFAVLFYSPFFLPFCIFPVMFLLFWIHSVK